MELRSRISEFATHTSVHGVQQLARNRTGLNRKILWIALFLVMNIIFISMTAGILGRYFSYNVEVSVKVRFEKKTEFPAVTLCNLNPVRRSALFLNKNVHPLMKPLIKTLQEIREAFHENPFANGDFLDFMRFGCGPGKGGFRPPPFPPHKGAIFGASPGHNGRSGEPDFSHNEHGRYDFPPLPPPGPFDDDFLSYDGWGDYDDWTEPNLDPEYNRDIEYSDFWRPEKGDPDDWRWNPRSLKWEPSNHGKATASENVPEVRNNNAQEDLDRVKWKDRKDPPRRFSRFRRDRFMNVELSKLNRHSRSANQRKWGGGFDSGDDHGRPFKGPKGPHGRGPPCLFDDFMYDLTGSGEDGKLTDARKSFLNQTELEEFVRNLTAENKTKDLPENFAESFWRFQEMQAFAFLRLKFMTQLNQLPERFRKLLGHQLEDSIVDCTFDGTECKLKGDFTTTVSPLFGACFTFNSANATVDKKKMRSIYMPGAEHGLTLEMLLDQQEYLKSITQNAGLRILVHDQRAFPFPEDEGVNVHPGMETSIGIRKAVVRRLESPYPSKCILHSNVDLIAKIDAYWYGSEPYRYSTQGCRKTCLQRTIVQHCYCARPGWPLKGPAFDDLPNWTGNESFCSTSWKSMLCVSAAEHVYNEKMHCDCPPSCLDVDFFPVISQSMWPSETYLAEFMDKLNRSSRFEIQKLLPRPQDDNFVHGPPWEQLKYNFVKVHIYYQDLSFQEILEIPSYSVPMLFGDLGGQVGLWLGLSVLTLFEVAELLFDIICLFMKNGRKQKTIAPEKMTRVAVIERL